ncbi:MAG: RdgB/HAM1 family non-canonical purine NTP pyrophosphatase [Patescibacteria group bacterium]
MKLVFATHNAGKLKEMRDMLAELKIDVLSADEVGVTEDIVEDGATFEENALKKARYVAVKSGEWAVADDSGICIDALDGAPGVNTARWAGPNAGDEGLIRHTLEMVRDVPEGKRGAHMVSCVAIVAPDGRSWMFEGHVNGSLVFSPRGTPRPKLPYDLLFIPEGHERTFAEMSDAEKNSMSHRGRAFEQMKTFLREQLNFGKS